MCSRISAAFTIVAFCLLSGGCPQTETISGGNVTATITGITLTGPAPLQVQVSGAASDSRNGAIASYEWNFNDEATFDTINAEYIFREPGRYPITLVVRDSTGATNSARVFARVAGGPVTARIDANTFEGPAPLRVFFDGTRSSAEDDRILDYYWEFGDGSSSQDSTPFHEYTIPGTYDVSLRAVSAGGVVGITDAVVTVGTAARSSLRFVPGEFARLPVDSAGGLEAWTLEIAIKPDAAGGRFVSFGVPNLRLAVDPATFELVVRQGDDEFGADVGLVAGQWATLALVYDAATGITVYEFGAERATVPLTGVSFTVPEVTLGDTFSGGVARVRLWNVARTQGELLTALNTAVPPLTPNRLGDWPLTDGAGQILRNAVAIGDDGTLGNSEQVEASDPSWVEDAP